MTLGQATDIPRDKDSGAANDWKTMSGSNPLLSHVTGCTNRPEVEGQRCTTKEEWPLPTEAMSWSSRSHQLSPEPPTIPPRRFEALTVRRSREQSLSTSKSNKMTEFPSYLNHHEVGKASAEAAGSSGCFPPRPSLGALGRNPF